MKYLVRRYFSGFCDYEIDCENEEEAYEIASKMPIKHDEVISTLDDWRDCDEVIKSNS